MKEGTRAALIAVRDGLVMLGVEQNIVHPPTIDVADLRFAHDELGYWRWDVALPGARGKLTKRGLEALGA